jgi:hypothetical protein
MNPVLIGGPWSGGVQRSTAWVTGGRPFGPEPRVMVELTVTEAVNSTSLGRVEDPGHLMHAMGAPGDPIARRASFGPEP